MSPFSFFRTPTDCSLTLCYSISKAFPEKYFLTGSICCSKPCKYHSELVVLSLMWRLPMMSCTLTPPPSIHYICWLLNCVLIPSQMVPLVFSPEDTTIMISEKNSKCELFRPKNNFPLHPSPPLNELKKRKGSCASGSALYTILSLDGWVFNWLWMQWWTVPTDDGFRSAL